MIEMIYERIDMMKGEKRPREERRKDTVEGREEERYKEGEDKRKQER